MKKIIGLVAILGAIFFTFCIVSYATGSGGLFSKLYQWGESRGEPGNFEDYAVARGKTIEVFHSDVKKITDGYGIFEQNKTSDDAIAFLVKRQSLVSEAIKRGVTVSDEEIDNYVQLQKDASNQASNLDQFMAFLQGADMTIDEYWNSQYEILKQDLYIQGLSKTLKEDFLSELPVALQSQADKESAWQARYEEIVDEIIAAENVEIIQK